MRSFAVPRGKVLSPRMWRDFVIEANDGIIATAGIVEGLVAADVRDRTILISAAIAMVVGSVSSAGARYTEAAFARDAALAAVAREAEQIDLDPEAELEELVEATSVPMDNLCRACFDGVYPVELPDPELLGKNLLELRPVATDADGLEASLTGGGASDALDRP